VNVAFQLGSFTVQWYSILIVLAVSSAVMVAYMQAKSRGEDTEHVFRMALIVIPLGIIGARLYHVIDRWDLYSQDPVSILGGRGLGIFGALIGGAAGILIYTQWKRLGTLRWLDIILPGVILAQAIGRWGNFFNQELYGYPTDLPWAIYIEPANRLPGYEAFSHFHPLFLYESLWNFFGCFLLLLLASKLKHRLLDGDILFSYAIYYGAGRFFFEGFKIDPWTIAGVPTARWIAAIAIIVSIAVMAYRRYRLRRAT